MLQSLINKQTYTCVGVMSGTSCDGLDIATCKFTQKKGSWCYEIIDAETIPYPQSILYILEDAYKCKGDVLSEYDFLYGKYIGESIKKYLAKNNSVIDFVASHGHTIFHQPKKGYTKQIGSGAAIAAQVDAPVICDFRSKNIALNGQGAPLVPIGDLLLFPEYDACVNLGGFSNISFSKDNIRYAYDICPVNIALNYFMRLIGWDYDENGNKARQGSLNEKLVAKLNALQYYSLKENNKSLGREWFEQVFLPVVKSEKLSVEDVLCTMVEHIAIQIGESLNIAGASKILFTGGGVYNQYLMDRIKNYSNNRKIDVPEKTVADFKEAMIFAFLGVLFVRGEVNVLKSYSGAGADCIGGALYL